MDTCLYMAAWAVVMHFTQAIGKCHQIRNECWTSHHTFPALSLSCWVVVPCTSPLQAYKGKPRFINPKLIQQFVYVFRNSKTLKTHNDKLPQTIAIPNEELRMVIGMKLKPASISSLVPSADSFAAHEIEKFKYKSRKKKETYLLSWVK